MSRLVSRLVDAVSRMLDADERDAVRGDLAELRATDLQTLTGVVGLVVRRQIALWQDWRPWLALVGVAAPLGLLLSLVSRQWANSNSIYAWLYVNNWTWGYLESAGSRLDLLHAGADFVVECAALICWSWTIGFALGSLSRRTVWINGTLFAVVLFAGTFGSATAATRNPANAVVFSLTFYSVLFPALLRTVLVLAPALRGIWRGIRGAMLPVRQAIVWAAAVTMLTVWAARRLEGSLMWGWWSASAEGPAIVPLSALRGSWALQLVPLAMAWPVAYMLVTASWRRWRESRLVAGVVLAVALAAGSVTVHAASAAQTRREGDVVHGVQSRDMAKLYRVTNLPVTVLIDRRGRIADAHAGMVVKDAWEQEIRMLLDERSR